MKLIKRILGTAAAAALLLNCLPMPAAAEKTVVNIDVQDAKVVQSSTLYAGEVIVDGELKFKYLYSDDITRSSTVLGAAKEAMKKLEDQGFTALIPGIVGEAGIGVAECSDAKYAEKMGESWKQAVNAAESCFSGLSLVGHDSKDLYTLDSGFAAGCRELWDGVDIIDKNGMPYELIGPLGTLSIVDTDSVTYTVIDGELCKIIDRDREYSCESITVIYTKAELTSVNPGDVNGDNKVNMKDLVLLRRYLNKWGVEIIRLNSDMNNDNNINLKDYVLLQRKLNKWDV